jgi:hypothetical protein
MAERKPCEGKRKDGQPCEAPAMPNSTWCYFHAPDRADERDANNKKGGRARSKRAATLPDGEDVVLMDVASVLALLSETVSQVRRGQVDPKIGNCLGYLASIALRSIEGHELTKQIEELRAEVEKMRNEKHRQHEPGTNSFAPSDGNVVTEAAVDPRALES